MRNSTDYKLGSTKTFRRASKKILNLWGTNLQNIKKQMREMYQSDNLTNTEEQKSKLIYWLQSGDTKIFTEQELKDIKVFLQVDQSGAEALIVAYDSPPGQYRQLFINNIKPHVYVGLKLFIDVWPRKAKEHNLLLTEDDLARINLSSIDTLKSNPNWREVDLLIKDSDNWPITERYYYLAKQTCHSCNYDIQGPRFRMNVLEKSGGKIVLTKEESERFPMEYRGLFPEIPEGNRLIKQQIDKHHILYNTLGFPYQITQYDITDHQYKEYYAWPRQSTVAEITRIAFTNLQSYIEDMDNDWDILADTHDSYLLQCPLKDAQAAKEKMQKFMNQRLISPFDGTEFYMKSECQVGFNWAPKKETNPLGLQELKWL
jgi:hypothetical protein